jgi:DNA polymerase-4
LRAQFGRLSDAVRRGIDPARVGELGDDRPAFREHDVEGTLGSISNERTFHADAGDRRRVEEQLRALSERVCWRARRRGITARTVTLKFRTSDFKTVTRGRTIPATHAEEAVYACVLELLASVWTPKLPVRLVGVQLSNLEEEGPQLALPLDGGGRPAVGRAIDAVRERFGYDAIRLGVAGQKSEWIA